MKRKHDTIRLFILGLIGSLSFGVFFAQAQEKISLKGVWYVKLDSLDIGVQKQWFNQKFDQPIKFPGTLDDAGIGERSHLSTEKLEKEVLLKLTRKHSYIGAAWYSKEIIIPTNWKNKDIELFLERVIWNTRVWIDGKEVGTGESLSAPHKFDTASLLKPGKHLLVIRIDNRKQYDISYKNMAHAYTDGTQIIWNGIIGKLDLVAKDRLSVRQVDVFPNVEDRSIIVRTSLKNNLSETNKAFLEVEVRGADNKIAALKRVLIKVPLKNSQQEIKLDLGENALLWDEFNPHLYNIRVKLTDKKLNTEDAFETKFGLRKISAKNNTFQLNGHRIFLRGTLECNIFPLKGYPPMEKDGWLKVFNTAKEYGLNHLRFHSWCPPKAAFEVADSMGFYLQVELPLWSLNVGKDKNTNRFLEEEAKRIGEEYGNHPSFILWSLGNELQGDFGYMGKLLANLKVKDNRHLYTTTTFTFEKGHGTSPEPEDEFFITQYTKKGWVRGQGIFNNYPPNFSTDYSTAVEGISVPLITHEIGQYSIYPNLKEIEKYAGVLAPLNFKAIKRDLERKQLIDLAPQFTLASGKFAANLYKEEIERALKTKGISGYQLLDLHDFPGQGTALVGLLDAFWESKGLVTPEDYRKYSSEVVPLIRFPKVSYTNSEQFWASAEIANFSKAELKAVIPEWVVTNRSGKVMFQGTLKKQDISIGNGTDLGELSFDLKGVEQAEMLTIELELKGTNYKNSWNIWVYPDKINSNSKDIVFTKSLTEALKQLDLGKKVLLNPDTAQIKGVEGRFAPVFWSPVHFPDQPGTMGILCDPKHPALQNFPTDFYSDWQWWDLISSSKTMIIDSLPAMKTPIVRVIDNFYKNRKMANIIEAKVGEGRLIIASVDISNDLENRPAARQLRYSLIQYMLGLDFNPAVEVTSKELKVLIKERE